jgi:thiosulfate/3-mercaptopyruvate sulfurtransferase
MTRTIDPIVSTDWLEAHLGDEGLVIVDVRWAEHYEAGHVPGAISVPFGLVSAWADSGELVLELPAVEDLFKTIGDSGMTADSKVVIVGPLPEPGVPPYALADSVRVAVTLIYAGVKNAAVLAGGHAKWESEGRRMTTDVPAIIAGVYSSAVDSDSWVSTEYVKDHIGRSVLIDGRDPNEYFGVSIDAFADMRGHIPTARCLPMIWVWEPDGTYRPVELIRDMAAGVVGNDKEREIICYCGAGGYASAWWFLLTQMLGYTNVKIYDGSMEAWVDEGNAIVAYTWTE